MTGPNSCEPCDCIPSNVGIAYFYPAVLRVLCQILAASGGSGTVATVLPTVTKAFGFFTNVFQALGFLDSAGTLRYGKMVNQTDGILAISLDGVNTNWIMAPNDEQILDFQGSSGPLMVADIQAKWTQAPSIGNFWIEGWY